jgi:hypothetical protein
MRGLTTEEKHVLALLAAAYNKHVSLTKGHPHDREGFCRAINAAQDIVMSRPAYEALKRDEDVGSMVEAYLQPTKKRRRGKE